MKKNIVLTLAFALLITGTPTALVRAESGSGYGSAANQNSVVDDRESSDTKRDDSQATSSVSRDREQKEVREQEQEHATSTDDRDDDHGEITSEEHRSKVADVVHSLLELADREEGRGNKGIGEEVRKIAHEQDDGIATTTDAIDHVSGRNSLLTFLFGTDYKNLGHIRSSIATMENHLSQLDTLRDRATTDADKAEIDAQIAVLKPEQDKLDAFVKAKEDVFSLFGWFVKLFAQ